MLEELCVSTILVELVESKDVATAKDGVTVGVVDTKDGVTGARSEARVTFSLSLIREV